MAQVLVGLGTNQGDREGLLTSACASLERLPQTCLLRRSSVIETAAVGGPQQPAYLNAAALLESDLSPQELLGRLQSIEQLLGRQRLVRWGARTIDLDLLLVGDQVIDSVELQLPHPRMVFRRFVIQPAAEVAGELLHPQLGWSLARLWQHLQQSPARLAIDADQAEQGASLREATAAAVRLAGVATSVVAWNDRFDPHNRPTIIVHLAQAQTVDSAVPSWQVLGTRHNIPLLRLAYRSQTDALPELVAAAQGVADPGG